jgi:hypothetical protein
MRTFAQKPNPRQQTTPAKPARSGQAHLGRSQVNSILHRQRTIGNQAVQRSVQDQYAARQEGGEAAAVRSESASTPIRSRW